MANIFGYIKESISEGDGLRSVLFISGCHGTCDGCHNPESWDKDFGYEFSDKIQDKIIDNLISNPLINGITFCGGEPFMSSKELISFIDKVDSYNLDIDYWSYSGYTIENIMLDDDRLSLLKKLDVLIDGRFIEEKKDLTLAWTGSNNQRVIDVQKTLQEDKVILYET